MRSSAHPNSCAQCNAKYGDDKVHLKMCSGCRAVFYCSRSCQRQHWIDGHKSKCGSTLTPIIAPDFEAACAHATTPACAHASVGQKARLYGLFKQQSHGNCTGQRPSAFKPVLRAKFDAWAAVKVRARCVYCTFHLFLHFISVYLSLYFIVLAQGMTPEKSRAEYVQCVQAIDPAFGQNITSSQIRASGASTAPRAISNRSMASNKPPVERTRRTELLDSTARESSKTKVRISASAASQPVSKMRKSRRRRGKRKGSIRTLAALIAMFCWALLLLTAPLARLCAEAERLFMRGATATTQDALSVFDEVDLPLARDERQSLSGHNVLAASIELAHVFSCLRYGNCSNPAEGEHRVLSSDEGAASD